MEITCASCVLRPLTIADAPTFARHANDRDIWLNLRDRFPHPYHLSDAEQFIAIVAAQPVQTTFAIVVDGEAAGSISLMLGSDIERQSAEIGYWLGRTYRGRGIATQAVGAVTQYGFEKLKLTRIFAVPFKRNIASARVLEKAGYALEGCLRQSAIKDGKVLDQLMYASIRSEHL